MKYRLTLGFFLIGLLAFLAACGTTSSPSSSSSSQTGQTPTNSTGTQTVNVMLFDDHISTSMTAFMAGTSYHFVVTNNGHQPYTFAMMSQDRENDMEHMSITERHQTALHMYDSIAPGQTQMFDYTFGSSMMGQHLEFACYLQGDNHVHMRYAFTPQS
ncbi:MAG TPA: hypothetical protein VNG51_02415 [Ktedonobacteraceae bacterium]|nr:hypothetical protein [Ktedonobacteraceae bacterium]